MNENLYFTRAEKFVSADPLRGRAESRTEYSSYFVVIASGLNEAVEKTLGCLKSNTRSKDWVKSDARKLAAGLDVPLEKRVEILGETLGIIK